MADDVVIAKARNIERCLARVREEFAAGDIHVAAALRADG